MSTTAEIEMISKLLAKMDQPLIVELGAYCGEDSEWMRAACNDTHALNVMVEPDPRNCAIIREHRRGNRTVLVQAAIADYTGMIDFYFAHDERSDGLRSGSGSIRRPTGHRVLFEEIKFPDPTPVMCWSLDHLMIWAVAQGNSSKLSRIDELFLWVDVQGAERDVIAGGQLTLDCTRYLFIEAEEVELYEGQALRAQLLELLPQFEVIREFDYNLLLEHR